MRILKGLVPRGSRVVRVRSERAFLKELPRATHAIVWHFRREWFDVAKRLELLATPAAGRELLPETGPDGVKIHFGGFHGPIMAESVAAFALGWARGFFRPELRSSAWPRSELSEVVGELAGTRAVILGYGRVGRAIGEKLSSLGVEVSGLTRHGFFAGGRRLPSRRFAEMPEQRCDAIWVVYGNAVIHPVGGRVLYIRPPEEKEKHEIDFLIT